MREIKFRAYHKKEKRFYCFDLETCTQTHYVGYYHPITDEKDCELDDPTLYSKKQLYTGLQDKNGKEIYEGDICKHTSGQVEVNSVEYYVGEWHLEPHDLYLSDECGEVEVIGNIYENPELLKEEI
uniref:Putative YopX protein n=1 Tax=viral metagenome TaxID=1070528 RepID=A0A6M3LPJ6_9ZZZZ